MWNTFALDKEIIAKEYSDFKPNKESRISAHMLEYECFKIAEELKNEPREIIKAKIFALIMDKARIEVSPLNWFPTKIEHENIIVNIRKKWKDDIEKYEMCNVINEHIFAQKKCLYTGDVDFSHTAPDWNAILKLGLTGLLHRAEEKKNNLNETQKNFYLSCEIVYKAMIRFVKRLSNEAFRLSVGNKKMKKVAESLLNLTQREPQSMLEAMQLSLIFYYVQTYVEGVNVRSFGGLDRLYYEFYKKDIESGEYTKEQIRELVDYWFYNFYALSAIANTPFYLCGKDKEGNTVLNELSYLFIEEYEKLNINDPKIHIRYTPELDESFVKKVLKLIADGKNSIVFLNDEVVIEALTKIGESEEDATEYIPIGCYEPSSMGKEVPCTCAGRINIAKAVECAINDGYDLTEGKMLYRSGREIKSFEDFKAEVMDVLKFAIGQTIELINTYEKHYMNINPAPLFSGTLDECMEKGMDAYAGGAKYNNTSINAFGLADAVDSLIAVKKAVFEEERLTLNEFKQILRDNWYDNEKLRMICKNCYPKYGNNSAEADEIMLELTELITSEINNKPNNRGGIYRCGMFSIDWYSGFGRATGALPDGKLNGEAISKNLNPVIGQDKNGATSLINSITKIDFSKVPNGAVLDLLLHSSVTKGEAGISVMLCLLKVFMNRGGFGIQINTLNSEILKKAQKHPEQYKNLQVRLCGWNVYFVNLSEQEQMEFIKMSESTELLL